MPMNVWKSLSHIDKVVSLLAAEKLGSHNKSVLQVERLEAKYLAHATTLYLFRQERVTAQLYS